MSIPKNLEQRNNATLDFLKEYPDSSIEEIAEGILKKLGGGEVDNSARNLVRGSILSLKKDDLLLHKEIQNAQTGGNKTLWCINPNPKSTRKGKIKTVRLTELEPQVAPKAKVEVLNNTIQRMGGVGGRTFFLGAKIANKVVAARHHMKAAVF